MSGKAHSEDPFAGYTPVRGAVSVVDEMSPQPVAGVSRKYRFGKNQEGNVSRTVKLLALLVVSALLIALIAAVSYGFIYEQQVEEPLPEVATNRIQRLAAFGRNVREKIRGVVPEGFVGAAAEDRGSATNGVSLVEKAFPVIGTFLGKSKRMKQASRGEDVEMVGESVAATNAMPEVKKREIDPALKRFKGGRRGRTIDNGERK